LSGGYFHLDQKSLDGGRVLPLLCDLWEAEWEVNSNKVKLPKVGSNVIVLVPVRARPNKGENFPELVIVEVLALELNISTCCKKPTILLHEKSEVIGAFGGGWVLAAQ